MKRAALAATTVLLLIGRAWADDGGVDAGADGGTDTDADTDTDTGTETDAVPCYLLCISEADCAAQGGTVDGEHPCGSPGTVCCAVFDTDTDTDGIPAIASDPMCGDPDPGLGCGCGPVGGARAGSLLSFLF